MQKIGITGGIGSGKSYVAQIFYQLGIPVYYSDIKARILIDTHQNIRKELTELLGDNIYLPTGKINKAELARNIFSSKEIREKVNSIIHPRVKQDFIDWCKLFNNKKYILKEAAILFETGTYKELDKIIIVTAPLELRIQRIMQRDGSTRQEIEKKINSQLPDDEKIKRSDFVIYNDEKKELMPQITAIHNALISNRYRTSL